MKTILFIILAGLALSFTSSEPNVYICNNGKTEVYHLNKECSALKRCTHGIRPMTLSEAKNKRLRLCGNED
jgi:hypothetical protein